MRDECEHGSLRRSCEICERDTRITELEAQVAVMREALETGDCYEHAGNCCAEWCDKCRDGRAAEAKRELALSTEPGQRAAAVLKAAREFVAADREIGPATPDAEHKDTEEQWERYYDAQSRSGVACQALYAAIDALDGRA